MPSSRYEHIPWMISKIREINPGTILDVGVGFGKWGFLCREYLDLWVEQRFKTPWKRRIDGIEAWAPYISPIHRYIYDTLAIEDASVALKAPASFGLLAHYDLILVCDVIEHLEKPEGLPFLTRLRGVANRVLCSLPTGDWPQGKVFDSPWEMHRSSWQEKELDCPSLLCSQKWQVSDSQNRHKYYWVGVFKGTEE